MLRAVRQFWPNTGSITFHVWDTSKRQIVYYARNWTDAEAFVRQLDLFRR